MPPAVPMKTSLLCSAGGQPMPQGWKSPMREADGTPKKLFQLVIERTSDGQLQRVGPAMGEDSVRSFCAVIGKQIALGNERQWSNPTVICLNAA